jgi:hypothetical protein
MIPLQKRPRETSYRHLPLKSRSIQLFQLPKEIVEKVLKEKIFLEIVFIRIRSNIMP